MCSAGVNWRYTGSPEYAAYAGLDLAQMDKVVLMNPSSARTAWLDTLTSTL